MARPRTFDPDDALDAAMHVFWRKGYAETSYDDLVSGTGVSRKGLYTAFGDKRALFLSALQHYRATVAKEYLAEVSRPGATARDLVAVFRSMIAFGATETGRLGCFMANTSVDEVSEDADVRKAVQNHFDAMASCFGKALLNSGYEDEEATVLADYLTGVFQGMAVLARSGASERRMRNMVETAVRQIE